MSLFWWYFGTQLSQSTVELKHLTWWWHEIKLRGGTTKVTLITTGQSIQLFFKQFTERQKCPSHGMELDEKSGDLQNHQIMSTKFEGKFHLIIVQVFRSGRPADKHCPWHGKKRKTQSWFGFWQKKNDPSLATISFNSSRLLYIYNKTMHWATNHEKLTFSHPFSLASFHREVRGQTQQQSSEPRVGKLQ